MAVEALDVTARSPERPRSDPAADPSLAGPPPLARRGAGSTAVHATLILAALGVGLLCGVDPVLGVAAALAVGFAIAALASITAGLSAFAVLAFLEELLPGEATKAAALMLVLSWLAIVATSHEGHRRLFSHPNAIYLLVVFVGWAAASSAWAEQPLAAAGSAFRYAAVGSLFLIAYAAVRKRADLLWVLGGFVAGALLSAAYGIFGPSVPDAAGRLSGAVGGANETAAVLVAGITLATALTAVLKGQPWLRVAAAASAVLCSYGVLLTVSRGALVALGVMLLVAVAVAGRWRTTVAVLALVLAAGVVTYFAVLAPPQARDRFEEVQGGTGRTDIWSVGWRMVEAHPIRGVGAGNYEDSAVRYLLRPGAIEHSEFIVDDPKVAHNIYLHVLAELGIVGVLVFLAIIAFALTCMLKAARAFAWLGDVRMEILARAVFVAVAGILAADLFASEQYSKQLWLLLSLGPPLLAIARNAAASPERSRDGGPRLSSSRLGGPASDEPPAALPR